MAGRSPSAYIAVDANIILSAALGFGSRRYFPPVAEARILVTTASVREEVERVIMRIAPRAGDRLRDAAALFGLIAVEPVPVTTELMVHAAASLRNAVASRNGSEADAHLLALAWLLDADIWSHDRDFAGTGWPSWSSANLAAALAEEG
jgi:predicted nucleic acid-binding protein